MPTYLLTFLSSLHNNPPSYTLRCLEKQLRRSRVFTRWTLIAFTCRLHDVVCLAIVERPSAVRADNLFSSWARTICSILPPDPGFKLQRGCWRPHKDDESAMFFIDTEELAPPFEAAVEQCMQEARERAESAPIATCSKAVPSVPLKMALNTRY